jgi:putative redox protein
MLVALGGCFTSHLLAAIRAREAPMTRIQIAMTGTMDGSPERFAEFSMNVSAECDDPELARKLIVVAARGCQVVNTLRQVAHIAISLNESPVEVFGPVAIG